MKKTYNEIIEILDKKCEDIYLFIYEDFDFKEIEDILGDWKEIFVSGGSDRGSHWVRVYHFVDHDVYIEVSGYYTSYDGVQLNDSSWYGRDIKEVRPKEVIKIIYQ